MKLPNSFRPEKDLDYKLFQLAQESKTENAEDSIYPDCSKELGDVLEEFASEKYHKDNNDKYQNHKEVKQKTDILLEKGNYIKLNIKSKRFTYWLNPATEDTLVKSVLIEGKIGDDKYRYGYAKISGKNLKKLTKRMKRCYKLDRLVKKLDSINIDKYVLVFGPGILGLTLAPLLASSSPEIDLFSLESGSSAVLGAIVGMTGTVFLSPSFHKDEPIISTLRYLSDKYDKNTTKLYDTFLGDDKDALVEAFK